MSEKQESNLIIYRYASTGLEVFMVHPTAETNKDDWRLPTGKFNQLTEVPEVLKNKIELEGAVQNDSGILRAIAIEADWHDLPGLRECLDEDLKYFSSKVRQYLPNTEKGAYMAIKEAFKKVMPHEYALLKELKDILLDRNSITNL